MKITFLTILYAVLLLLCLLPSVFFLFSSEYWGFGFPILGLLVWLAMGFGCKWWIPTYKNFNGKREV